MNIKHKLLLTIALIFSLSGCGNKESSSLVSHSSEETTADSSNSIESVSVDVYTTIHFDLDGGSSQSYIESKRITKLSIDDFFFDCYKNDYNFRGWSYNDEQILDEDENEIIPLNSLKLSSSMTFKAIFRQDSKITIKKNIDEAGSVKGDGYYKYGADVTLTATPNIGYEFIGWFDNETLISDQETYTYKTGNTDLILEARFKLKDFKLNVSVYNEKYGGIYINPTSLTSGTDYVSSLEKIVAYTDTVTVSVYSKDNDVSFLGWFDENNNLISNDIDYTFTMPNDNYSLIAIWNRFNITYILDDGVNNPSNPEYVDYETKYELKDPTKDGYDFMGWYTDENYTNQITAIPYNTTNDLTLYAKWKSHTYTITLDATGGKLTTYTIQIDYGSKVELPTPTRKGYNFICWTYNKEEYNNEFYSYTYDITLEASWEAKEYNITYVLDGGTLDTTLPTKYTPDDEIKINAVPAKNGYDFVGWRNQSDSSTKPTKEYVIPKGTTEDIYIYAVWTLSVYNITYNLDGGTNNSANPNTYTIESSVTLKDATKKGYKFLGWYNGKKYSSSISLGTTGNLTFTAKWEIINYSIAYDLAGGSISSSNPTTYNVETSTIILKEPTRNGYKFLGWYNGSEKVTSIAKGTTGNLNLVAKWSANKYSINVTCNKSSCGSVTVNGQGYTDENITLTAIPDDDCVFGGWYKGGVKISSSTTYSFVMPASDYSIEAKFWSKDDENYGIVPVFNDTSNTVTYGLFPQTHISDSTTIAALEKLAGSSTDEAWYNYNGSYYAKYSASPYKTNYVFDDGTTIVKGTTYWFKCEPIEWNIIETKGDTYTLVTSKLLDVFAYNTTWTGKNDSGIYCNNYQSSYLRQYMIGSFAPRAFVMDSSLLQTITVDNSASTTDSSSNTYCCDNTTDSIYALSYQDYNKTTKASRICKTTDWARANGALVYTSSTYYNCGGYWTRSPLSSSEGKVNYVSVDGSIPSAGIETYAYMLCIRPAITIKYVR